MRKLTLILLSILLVTALFVSCKVEVNDSEVDLVYLRLTTGDDTTRSLSSSRTTFSEYDYDWYYTASKVDDGPSQGSTNETVLIKKASSSYLCNTSIGPFSPGEWLFTLYGYKADSTDVLVYKGSRNITLKTKSSTPQTIAVAPQKADGVSGKLVIASDISFTADDRTYKPNYITINSGAASGSAVYSNILNQGITGGYSVDLPSGAYMVELSYKTKDENSTSYTVYAVNTIVVNIWNTLTTTISGSLDAKTYTLKLDVEDAGNVVVTEDTAITSGTEKSYVFKFTPTNYTSADVVGSYSSSLGKNVTEVKGTFVNETSVESSTLTLTAYNTDASRKKYKSYDFSGSEVGTFELSLDGATISDESTVAVTSYITTDLEGVSIVHILEDGTTEVFAEASSSSSLKAGEYYYADGKIEFVTGSLGQFVVLSGQSNVFVTKTGETSRSTKKFDTLERALANTETGCTFTLQDSVSTANGIVISEGKKLTLNLNGKNITSSVKQAITVYGDLTIDGEGTVSTLAVNGSLFVLERGKSKTVPTLTIKDGTFSAPTTVITGSGNDAGDSAAGDDSKYATNITISGGSFTSTGGTAIYHPQNGKLTISGGTFTGGTSGSAVEIRAGQATISGGKFNSSAGYSVAKNGSGTTVVGAALAVSQHSTEAAKNMVVTISNGTFSSTGSDGKQVAFVYTCGDSSTNSAELKILTTLVGESGIKSIEAATGTTTDNNYTVYTAKATAN